MNKPDDILLFGHRGYSAIAPENTLSAFQAVLDHKIPGIELDVHLCSSGELVVFHDYYLERITGSTGLIEDLTLSEIRKLDAGSWFNESFRGEKIPLLNEVFELLGEQVYYDIELKWEGWKTGIIEEKVLKLIHRYKLQHRCLVSSFNMFCVRKTEKLDKDIPTALIYSNHSSVPFLVRRGEGRLICRSPFIKPYHKQVHALSVAFYQKILKSKILTWTVDDEQEAKRLINLGVRGIISNDPGKIKKVISAS